MNTSRRNFASASRKLPSRLTLTALAIAMLAATIPAYAAPPSVSAQDFAPGRILVEPRAGLGNADFDKILKEHGGKRRKLGQSNIHVVELPPNASPVAVVARLAHNPHLKFAELDRRVQSTVGVNDPYIGSAWHLTKIGAGSAWDTTMGAGVTIAILDSGIDTAHPDLKPNLVTGFNVYGNNSDVSDVCGHGTSVAGTAAAVTNNGTGVASIAGQAKIMPVRIAYYDTTKAMCYAYYSTVADGLTYAADNGARVANVSYAGVAGSTAIQSAANYMKSKGGLVVVSAGNAGINENITPTTAMVVVSATDSADTKTSWSSYGSFVTLSAPGAGIWSTNRGGSYGTWNGTSFSSPLTAGVAALLMATGIDGAQAEKLMNSTALDRGVAGRDPLYGYGRVDAAAAMSAARASAPVADTQAPNVAISAPLGSSSVTGLVAVNVNASDNVGVADVELRVNGSLVALDSSAPFAFSWNSAGVANGMATLVAVARDAAGNTRSSAPVSVNVANVTTTVPQDTTPPAVAITNPVAGRVSGAVTVTTNASDNAGAAGISQTLYIDGVAAASGTGSTLAYKWNTRKASAGTHTIKAVAKDKAGNTTTTSVVVTK